MIFEGFIPVLELARFLTVKRSLSTSSVHLVTTRYRLFCKWLEKRNLPHTKDSTEQFLYELKISGLRNNSINTYIFMFKELQAYYIDRGIDIGDFSSGLKNLAKTSRPIDILTPDEIEKIINTTVPYGYMIKPRYSSDEVTQSLNSLYHAFTYFLSVTGARFSEAAALKVRYLDLGQGKATFIETKNKTNRSVWITEPLISELRNLVADKELDELVFTNLQGKPVIPQNYGFHLHRACKIIGLKKRVHPHIFRHSFATQLLMSGVDVTMVASLLGHQDIQTTYQNYVHLADESLKKSVYRHPLVRKFIDPREVIKMIKDSIASYKVDNDERFIYTIIEGQNSLQFTIGVK